MSAAVAVLQPRLALRRKAVLTFLVPLRSNAGKQFAHRKFQTLERHMEGTFGGWTREPNVTGGWQWEGRVYRDRSRKYCLLLEERQLPVAVTEIETRIQRDFQQKAVYLTVSWVDTALT